ncbi:MAG: cell division protein ZapA [Oscillospiraceae bacterium]|nr:cell division protein ZapA [Oscillospiraceae bacterium]
MTNRVKIEILGTAYTITSQEDEAYILQLAAEIDERANMLLSASPKLTPIAAMVLCALDYADSLKKSEETADHLRAQITDYLK